MDRLPRGLLVGTLMIGILLADDGAGAGAAPARVKLTYPGRAWSLIVHLPGFDMQPVGRTMDGVMVEGTNEKSGLVISVSLEKAPRRGDAVACRKYYWKKTRKSPMPKTNVVLTERGTMAVVEYLIPSFMELPINQKNFNAYMSHDGVWIDVHLSKVDFRPADAALFEAVLRSVRIAK
jgi:hypothetical protein